MGFFNEWGRFMMAGARAHATWELEVSRVILRTRDDWYCSGCSLSRDPWRHCLCRPVVKRFPIFGREDGLQPGLLFHRHFRGIDPHRGDCRPDHRLHRSRGGFVIAPAMMSAGIKGSLRWGPIFSHLCQGDHGKA